MKLVVRTAASHSIGLGHLNRCLILVDAINKLLIDTTLLVEEDTLVKKFIPTWSVPFLAHTDPADWPHADACIVDLYCCDEKVYEKLSKRYKTVIIFDDNSNLEVSSQVSGIINTNILA